MSQSLLYPPVAFLIIFFLVILLSALLSRLAFRAKEHEGDASGKCYACGEDMPEQRMQVNYGQFFHFAFFFTILHVFTLMIATVPIATRSSFSIAVIYIIGAVTGLFVLFRR